jgi:hypothetical protein
VGTGQTQALGALYRLPATPPSKVAVAMMAFDKSEPVCMNPNRVGMYEIMQRLLDASDRLQHRRFAETHSIQHLAHTAHNHITAAHDLAYEPASSAQHASYGTRAATCSAHTLRRTYALRTLNRLDDCSCGGIRNECSCPCAHHPAYHCHL